MVNYFFSNSACKDTAFFAYMQIKSAVCSQNCTFLFSVRWTFIVLRTFIVAAQRLFTREAYTPLGNKNGGKCVMLRSVQSLAIISQ